MGLRTAGRREKRIAKRQSAKESRTTKYKNQKGGGTRKTAEKTKFDKSQHVYEDRDEEDDGEDMAVIRDGKPIWSRSKEPDPNAEPDAEDEEGEQRFSSAEKKLRALKKKMRKIDLVKKKRKQGFELDTNQLQLLRTEKALATQISIFEDEVATAQHEEADMEQEEEDDISDRGNGAGTGARVRMPQGRVGIEERRAIKKQRHLAKLTAKQRKADAK